MTVVIWSCQFTGNQNSSEWALKNPFSFFSKVGDYLTVIITAERQNRMFYSLVLSLQSVGAEVGHSVGMCPADDVHVLTSPALPAHPSHLQLPCSQAFPSLKCQYKHWDVHLVYFCWCLEEERNIMAWTSHKPEFSCFSYLFIFNQSWRFISGKHLEIFVSK